MRRRGYPRTHCQFESKGAQRHLSPSRYGEEPHHHCVVPLPFSGEAYLSNLLKSKSLPLTSLPSVALLVTRILMVWIMMMKSSKMS